MTERRHHLEGSLNQLRSEIDALASGDLESRQRLEKLIRDIEERLDDPPPAGADDTLGEQLKTSVLAFEASHPRLAAAMNEIMEKLAHMGI